MSGVRLIYEKNTPKYYGMKYGPISLEVRATSFNFSTGQLTITKNNTHSWRRADWLNPDDTKQPMVHPDEPTLTPSNNIYPDERYSIFRVSDLRLDGGQSTVPYFDTQKVELSPGFALDGVGLVRKGHKDGGGFLTFRISTIDISKYIIN